MMVAAVPVLPVGYVVSASRIADRRMILAGYRVADMLRRVTQTLIDGEFSSIRDYRPRSADALFRGAIDLNRRVGRDT